MESCNAHVRGFTMRRIAAAAAFALGFGLASQAHAQTEAETPAAPEVATSEVAAESAPEITATMLEEPAPDRGESADPWEGFNRDIYAFNDALDRAIVEPTAK